MIIYRVINKISGKVYIGQTIKGLDERIAKHIKTSNSSLCRYCFHRAIRKYGIDNFEWEIIEECNSKEEMDELEFHYIKQYNSLVPNGYNMVSGGEGWFGGKHSENTKNFISGKLKNYYKNHDNPFFGKTHSKETKVLMSEKLKGKMIGENNSFYGKKHSEETRKKISDVLLKSDSHVNRGKCLSEEWRRKISESNKGRIWTVEQRAKYAESRKGKLTGKNSKCAQKFIITSPCGHEFCINGLSAFSKEYEGGLLDFRLLSAVANGKRNHHKGYKCRHYNPETDFGIQEYKQEPKSWSEGE